MALSINPPLFTLLPGSLVEAVTSAGVEVAFDDGQTIHSKGQDRPGLSIVLSGRVRFGAFSEEGAFVQTGLLGKGHCFGEVTLFSHKPRAYHADAFGQTRILQIGKSKVERLIADHPAIATALLATLTSRLYDALDFADDLRSLKLEARVAKQLWRFAVSDEIGNDVIPIRQNDLAYALGLSRVSIGKALKVLQDLELIELGYGAITIVDRARLEDWIASTDSAAF
ncbi:MAG: Crp/Fnr family transcriptional regulator [Pseudomonadota bacterium]